LPRLRPRELKVCAVSPGRAGQHKKGADPLEWIRTHIICWVLLIFHDAVLPGHAEQPPDAEQPAGVVQPVDAEQPAGVVQPAGAVQPAGVVQPAGAVQPVDAVQPVRVVQPADAAQPVRVGQPVDAVQPADAAPTGREWPDALRSAGLSPGIGH